MKALRQVCFAVIAMALAIMGGGCNNGNNGDGPDDYVNKDGYVYDFSSSANAVELVSKMRVGWNLGNTFDSGGGGPTVTGMETAWLNPQIPTTKENIDTLRNAGFNVLRIPVSWNRAADAANNYTIREDWLERIAEVVGYGLDNEMFVILNSHHDTRLFRLMDSNVEESLRTFKRIWEQIAGYFKDYDEQLIFEALNEPRTPSSNNEWNGGSAEERNNLNKYYQVFVDTVRASGSVNADRRFLVVNPYAASGEAAAMNGLELPEDTVPNRIIVSYHSYEPYMFALNTDKTYNTWNEATDTYNIVQRATRYYNKFVAEGIPVFIGETGAMNKDNLAARTAWAEYYVKYHKDKDMPCIWWDNGATTGDGELFAILDRATNKFPYPKIIDALMKGTR